MRISLQPAFILHHRPYRESSLIIDFLTQEYGRISLIARGVRVARSKNRSILQSFVPLFVSWQGKSELMTLTGVEASEPPFRLRGNCLLSGFYLNEILMRVLHKHDPYTALYSLYDDTLRALQREGLQQKILRLFEKKLLEELGYGLQLQYDILTGKPLVAEERYRFHPEQGFKLCQGNEALPEWTFLGKSLLALLAEDFNEVDCLRDAKRLMRLAFLPLLGSKPLQSRKLFLEVE